MLLSDADLRASIISGEVHIEPTDESLIQPASIDVRLGDAFRTFTSHQQTHIDPSIDQGELTQLIEMKQGESFVLHPREFVLASTLESISLGSSVAARIEGKSSLGRIGLMTHSTAGWIDPGFSGAVTLELSNVASLPIRLWPGMSIGQLCVFRLSSPAEHPYGAAPLGSHYQGQRGPTPSRSHERFRTWPTTRTKETPR